MITLDEAIKHCKEVAEKNEEMCRVKELMGLGLQNTEMMKCARTHKQLGEWLIELKKLREQTRWIPVSERLPEDLEAVNITWVNHEPEPYYHDIKDRNFTATGIHYRGKWYWYSTTCADYLGEYGSNEVDEVDSAIEIVAWMPLPSSYQGE